MKRYLVYYGRNNIETILALSWMDALYEANVIRHKVVLSIEEVPRYDTKT